MAFRPRPTIAARLARAVFSKSTVKLLLVVFFLCCIMLISSYKQIKNVRSSHVRDQALISTSSEYPNNMNSTNTSNTDPHIPSSSHPPDPTTKTTTTTTTTATAAIKHIEAGDDNYTNPNFDPILERLLQNSTSLDPKVLELLSLPIINPHNFDLIVGLKDACAGPLDLLVIVPSAPEYFARRARFRLSPVAKFTQNRANRAKFLFFVGMSPNDIYHRKVMAESNNYGDMVIEKFPDIYRNILLKSVFMLKWVSHYCSHVDHIIRHDDDLFIRTFVPAVKELKTRAKKQQNFILGHFSAENSWAPMRSRLSKYYLPRKEFPPNYFPPFTRGGFIGFPQLTIQLLFEASLRVKSIWLDDVYITAMCADRIGALKITTPNFNF